MAERKVKSVFELTPDQARETLLDAAADAEIDAGHGVDHEKVREWLAKLAQGEKILPPRA